MFYDWLSQARRSQISPAQVTVTPPPDAARSLAVGVLQLCGLCEELLAQVAAQDAAASPLLRTVPERLEAVRACAGEICERRADAGDSDGPYSLRALGGWAWREV